MNIQVDIALDVYADSMCRLRPRRRHRGALDSMLSRRLAVGSPSVRGGRAVTRPARGCLAPRWDEELNDALACARAMIAWVR